MGLAVVRYIIAMKFNIFLFLSDLQALGMENNHISDASIVASTETPGHAAAKGRLNGKSCWKPNQNKDTEHLTVSFAAKVTIVAIATQGSPIDDCWVESYSFQWFTGNLIDNPKVKICLISLTWSFIIIFDSLLKT